MGLTGVDCREDDGVLGAVVFAVWSPGHGPAAVGISYLWIVTGRGIGLNIQLYGHEVTLGISVGEIANVGIMIPMNLFIRRTVDPRRLVGDRQNE